MGTLRVPAPEAPLEGKTAPMARPVATSPTTLTTRLLRGEHLVLYGPRGSGKSTLLARIYDRLSKDNVPCALSKSTVSLRDMTSAWSRAYPAVDTSRMTQRRARARLLLATEQRAGVLLLDHMTRVNSAMRGFIHRLRGRLAGVLIAVDVDGRREWQALRELRLGMPLIPISPQSMKRQKSLFQAYYADLALPPLSPAQERQILRAARGRPGWIGQCSQLIRLDRYWHGQTLYASVLCIDTEIALQLGDPHPFVLVDRDS